MTENLGDFLLILGGISALYLILAFAAAIGDSLPRLTRYRRNRNRDFK